MANERVLQQIRKWRDELIDLSRRNRLLNLTSTKSSSLSITEPALDEILGGLRRREGWRFHYPVPTVAERDDPALMAALHAEDTELSDARESDELLTDVRTSTQLSTVLRTLKRRADQEYVDKGLRVLYLAVGVLEWFDDTDRWRSPILLVPVSLERANPRLPFRLQATADDAVVNPALVVKMQRDFDLALPTDVDDGLAADSVLRAVETTIAGQRRWRVDRTAVLALFSFQKEVMYRDLLDNEATIVEHPAVQALALGGGSVLGFEPVPQDRLDEVAPPEQLVSILDADATQRQCIVAARDARSFVMDGPPGSGKSQTIANIVAELIATGKTTLFVSEKAAALEVVQSRLEEAGLGTFLLPLHSHKATRKEFAAALDAALRERGKAGQLLPAVELAQLENRRKHLSGYAAAVNQTRDPLGHSLNWAMGRCGLLDSLPKAPLPESIDQRLTADQFANMLETATALAGAWGPVSRRGDFLWHSLADTEGPRRHVHDIDDALTRLSAGLADLRSTVGIDAAELDLPSPRTLQDVRDVSRIQFALAGHPTVPDSWLTAASLDSAERRTSDLEDAVTALERMRASLRDCLSRWREIDPGSAFVIHGAVDDLSKIHPSFAPAPDDSADRLAARLAWVQQAPNSVRSILDLFGELADAFRLTSPAPDLTMTASVAEVAALGGAIHRPEQNWFDSKTMVEARDALAVLHPIVDEYRKIGAQLESQFKPELREFDVETLYSGDQDQSPALGWMSSKGRANRKALAAYTRDGKLSRAAIAQLPLVRSWQRVAKRLQEAEQERSAVLGVHYYRRADTDFAALEEALDVADRALRLIGSSGDGQALAEKLARPAVDADRVAEVGRSLRVAVETFQVDLATHLPSGGWALATCPLVRLASLFEAALDPSRAIHEVVAAITSLGGPATYQEATAVAAQRADVAQREAALTASADADAALLGPLYRGELTVFDEIRSALQWATGLRQLVPHPVGERIARRLLTWSGEPGSLAERVAMVEKPLAEVLSHFTAQRAEELRADFEVGLRDGEALARALQLALPELDEWSAYSQHLARLQKAGLGRVADFCIDHGVSASELVGVIERAVLAAWIESVFTGEAGRLEPLRSDDRDRIVREFAALDRRMRDHAIARVVQAGNARRPVATTGAAGTIVREAQKKTRHMRIEDLLRKSGPVALDCKPCFLMSPLAVSSFIPSDLEFDVVIFDEASQVRPSDAINCIYRGKQLIVAGDERQLPPTSFFDRMTHDGEDDDYEEEQLDDFESVLKQAKAGALPELGLRWHYRSRAESLITFSNYSFYEGKLITYPGALDNSGDLGVDFVHVPDGVYLRGGARDNPVEAQAVVARVLDHATRHPTHSLGVVTFSEAQASRIAYELEAARRERPDLDGYFTDDRLDGFFVKNLESVQGDERDIIIFSVGYGKDESGKLTNNFGPVNRAGGWRRLNVAFTRARRRVEVVASITAGDIDSPNPGVQHLKRYLDYAQRGLVALSVPVSSHHGDAESPFEEAVLRSVRSMGYDVVPQVGQAGYRIDMAVRHPSKPGAYVLGIECDGAMYHGSRVARDRDRLRQQVLEGLGWRLHRIWGPAWYRSPGREQERLRNAIEDAMSGRPLATAQSAPKRVTPTDETVETVDLDAPVAWTVPYKRARPGVGHHHIVTDPASGPEIDRVIAEIVRVEAPISVELCLQRVREAFHQARLGAKIRQAIEQRLNAMLRRREIIESDGFLSPPGHSGPVKVRVPDGFDPDTKRDAGDVAPSEMAEAIISLVRDAHSVDDETLARSVARLFRWKLTAETQQAVRRAVDACLARGELARNAAGLSLAP